MAMGQSSTVISEHLHPQLCAQSEEGEREGKMGISRIEDWMLMYTQSNLQGIGCKEASKQTTDVRGNILPMKRVL
jgi:hypothetical protein